jgi:carboxyl-terminal processing protease
MKLTASYTRPTCTNVLLGSLFGLSAILSGCGGGGGYASTTDRNNSAIASSTTPTVTTGSPAGILPAKNIAAQCATPRTGIDPATKADYADTQGSITTEKSWVRSYINDTYLWYSEVPNPVAANYATATDYFAVLKTPATTASGAPKDKFHFTYTTPVWLALSQSGVSVGYGIDWTLLANRPPRSIVVSQVTPGSVAEAAGIQRGATVLTVDGVDVVNGSDTTTLNAGLFPTVTGQSHTFTVKDVGATTTRQVTLQGGAVTSVPVQNVKTLSTPTGLVGYVLFNDHIATAETQLIAAVNQLKTAKVVDLVLDVRYNGGGYLDIAGQLAYMIAGPTPTTGKFFEKLTFNDKNPFGATDADTITPFHTQTLGFSATKGQPLPYLGLNHVTVLTTSRTCSASEAIVNGLRGAGITVDLIGGTTCGKPYGFIPQDNCGVTYFAIQFKGVNQLGFGDYSDGFAPTCAASDDYTRALGDPAETQLAAALAYRISGVCPVTSASTASEALKKRMATSATSADTTGLALTLPENPARNNRILR